MTYIFTFKEINYGVVSIEADAPPSRDDVVDEIKNGEAYFSNTDYSDIELADMDISVPIETDSKNDKPQIKEYAFGYEITQEYNFKDNIGIALAENKDFRFPFVTLQYSKMDNGIRNYFWERYFSCAYNAIKDYTTRISDQMKSFDRESPKSYRYYAMRERIVHDNFPKPYGDPESIICFSKPAFVEGGKFKSWGYIEYHSPLTEKQIKDYGLRASSNNPATPENTGKVISNNDIAVER